MPELESLPSPQDSKAGYRPLHDKVSWVIDSAKHLSDKAKTVSPYVKYGLEKFGQVSQPVLERVVEPVVGTLDTSISRAYSALQTQVVSPIQQLHNQLDSNKDGHVSLGDLKEGVKTAYADSKLKETLTNRVEQPVKQFLHGAHQVGVSEWQRVLDRSQGTLDRWLPETNQDAEIKQKSAEDSSVDQQSKPSVTLSSLTSGASKRLRAKAKFQYGQIRSSDRLKRVVPEDLIVYIEQVVDKVQTTAKPRYEYAQQQLDTAVDQTKRALRRVRESVEVASKNRLAKLNASVQPYSHTLKSRLSNANAKVQELSDHGLKFVKHRAITQLPVDAVHVLALLARSYIPFGSSSSPSSSPLSTPSSSPSLSPSSSARQLDEGAKVDQEYEDIAAEIQHLLGAVANVFYWRDWKADEVKPEPENIASH